MGTPNRQTRAELAFRRKVIAALDKPRELGLDGPLLSRIRDEESFWAVEMQRQGVFDDDEERADREALDHLESLRDDEDAEQLAAIDALWFGELDRGGRE